MNKETYIKMMDYLKSRKRLAKLINILYTALPIVMVVAYPAIVVLKGIEELNHGFLLTIVVPAVTLVGVRFMRIIINRPRPYEKFGVSSLIFKDKKGQSFPSNHAACGFVIAMAGFTVNIILGFTLSAIALIIALTRIFSGVHFISDVIAGTAIGLLMGSIFLFV